MQLEMESLMKHGTGDLVQLLKGKHALLCKWVYKQKMSPADALPKYVPKYKAQLVAKGFKQEKSIYFDEIFYDYPLYNACIGCQRGHGAYPNGCQDGIFAW